MPLVSILIPTYNQPEFFRQALESALSQDYSNIEILVSDDSTDDRVEKIASEYKNRIRFFKHEKSRDENLGYENMIFLLNQARGEFVNFLFHDDLFMPTKISRMIKFFRDDRKKQIAFVTSRRYVIDDATNVLRTAGLADINQSEIIFPTEIVAQKILQSCNNFVGELSSVLMRREDLWCEQSRRYEICRFLNLSGMIANCDIPTYLEICRKNPQRFVVFIDEPLSCFRRHLGQNGHDLNIVLDTFFEWAAMISVAHSNKIFITSDEILTESCDNWLKLVSNLIQYFADADNLDAVHVKKLDNLMRMIDACGSENLDLFLGLSQGGYE